MTGKEVITLLKQHGWQLGRVSGSHHIMIKAGQRSIPIPIPIPVHGSKDISKGLLHAIFSQADIKP